MMNFNGFFVKFGAENHIMQLRKEGLLYCRTVHEFAKIEDDSLRGDKLEIAYRLNNAEDSILQIKPVNAPDSDFTKIKLIKYAETISNQFGNLFCLHAINYNDLKEDVPFNFDKRNKEFGSHFIMINFYEFIKRLHIALDKLNYRWKHNLVEYKDFSKYKGEKTVFQKDKTYEYQKEFRLFIENKIDQHIKIYIGDISDISIIYSSSYIDTLKMKFSKPKNHKKKSFY